MKNKHIKIFVFLCNKISPFILNSFMEKNDKKFKIENMYILYCKKMEKSMLNYKLI